MRTTLTLDDDVANEIRRLMKERDSGFKETINDLLRRSLRDTTAQEPYTGPTFASGTRPGVDLDKALGIAAGLEDAELVRKIDMGK